jgi:hypothetical protein
MREIVMLSWMYWPQRAQETTRSGGERREPTLADGRPRSAAKKVNEVLELKLVEPEEFGNDPYNRIGPLSRGTTPRRNKTRIP